MGPGEDERVQEDEEEEAPMVLLSSILNEFLPGGESGAILG